MSLSINLQWKGIIWVVIISFFVIIVLGEVIKHNDPSRGHVENFIDSAPVIAQRVGHVKSKKLLRATLVASTGDRGSYQRYIYRVTGNDGKIEVVIMVEGGENKEPYIKEIIAR